MADVSKTRDKLSIIDSKIRELKAHPMDQDDNYKLSQLLKEKRRLDAQIAQEINQAGVTPKPDDRGLVIEAGSKKPPKEEAATISEDQNFEAANIGSEERKERFTNKVRNMFANMFPTHDEMCDNLGIRRNRLTEES